MHLLSENDTFENIQELSDEQILSHSVKHPHLFEVLLDRYQDAFLRKARGVLGSREDAEDIVQEAFAKIYLNAHRFKVQEGASFKSWAYKILLNTSFTKYQKLRRERNTRIMIDPEVYESFRDSESRQFEKQEVSEYIISILARIPDHLSRALYLYIIEGRPQEEIAQIEDISVGAVKTRVHRAKKAFRKIDAAII